MRKTPTLQKPAHHRGRRRTQSSKPSLYSVFTLRASASSAVNTAFLMMILILALLAATVQAEDYSNNIGFMKNPPKELKEKFPMCDQFLDVKWIKQFPLGNWVGMVMADVYWGDRKDQRELIVMQRYDQGDHYISKMLDTFDVSDSIVKGNRLEILIKSADHAFRAYWIGTNEKAIKGFAVEINGKLTEISKKKGYPNVSENYAKFSQNICVILPNRETGWMIENKFGGYGKDYLKSNALKGNINGR